MRVVSRNCTEDGWSEPFPHYFDACGFDDYESETGDQVRVRLPPAGGGGGAEEVQARVFPPGALTARGTGLREAQVLRQPSWAFAVSPSQVLGGEDAFIHSGLRSSWFAARAPPAPTTCPPPPWLLPGCPGHPAFRWPGGGRVDAGPSGAPAAPFPGLRLVRVRVGQGLCIRQAFTERLQSVNTCAERRKQLSRGQGVGEAAWWRR